MPKNLLDNITWNFIKEGTQPSVRSYILSVMEKLEALKPNSTTDNDRVATAIRDLKEIKKHVNRLEEELEQAKQDYKELQEKYNKLKVKLRAPKEE